MAGIAAIKMHSLKYFFLNSWQNPEKQMLRSSFLVV